MTSLLSESLETPQGSTEKEELPNEIRTCLSSVSIASDFTSTLPPFSEKRTNDEEILHRISQVFQAAFVDPATLPPAWECNQRLLNVKDVEIKLNLITPSRLAKLKMQAKKAIARKKIFKLQGTCPVIEETLSKRGWLKTTYSHSKKQMNFSNGGLGLSYEDAIRSLPEIQREHSFEEYWKLSKNTILSLLLENTPPNLIWSSMRWSDMRLLKALDNPHVILNKIGEPSFTPKSKLTQALRMDHWFYKRKISEVNFPRTYLLFEKDELAAFRNDYRNTACIGFLRYVVEMVEENGLKSLFREKAWHIPFSTFEFALRRCMEIWQSFRDDYSMIGNLFIVQWDWESLIGYHQLLVSNTGKMIQAAPGKDLIKEVMDAKSILIGLKKLLPQYSIDGCRNIWMLKPKHSMRGTGIVISNRLEDIEELADDGYLAQKYVENFLPIFNAKGDFRQFFLVTSTIPLQVWMYKKNYIRLSTQAFNFSNFDPSVHVTNHTIQKKYPVDKDRDVRLPRHSMWDTETFQQYLTNIGRPHTWEKVIYPQMQHAIIECLLANQEFFLQRLNNFELFGADFIIDENCSPWLMEINQNPDLSPSTPVTSKLCPSLATDLFKDWKQDSKAHTGDFEMIYNQQLIAIPSDRKFLSIEGKQFSRDDIKRQMYQHLVASKASISKAKNT